MVGDSPVLFMKGLQIVNGCQTVSTLIKAYRDEKIAEDIYVTCRFIKRSDDQVFIQSVITNTNSQNAISDRDLHANDRIQYDIQGILRSLNIFYERKLNEYREKDDEYRLDALDAAQSYLCCELQEPHRAKQEKRKLFNEFYYRIFDSNRADLAYKLLLSSKILEYVLDRQAEVLLKKRQIKKQGKTPRFRVTDLVVAHGSYHVAAKIYEQLFSNKSPDKIKEIAKLLKLPANIILLYTKSISDLVKHIKNKNIERENIAKSFKSIDSHQYLPFKL